jgi:hypothetical protein
MSRAARVFAVLSAVACLVGVSCGGDDDPAGEGGGGGGGQDIAKVSMALTGGVDFENGSVVAALLPDPTNDTVELDQSATTLSLEPGGSEILPLEITNPEAADTQVEAVLLQFEESDGHIHVTVEGSEQENETIELPFTIDDGICDALCNEVVQLKLKQAVQMTDGTISEHLERTLELDCSDDGDPDQCESEEPDPEQPGGSDEPDAGSGSGSSGASVTRANNFATALIGVNNAACSCAPFTGSPCDAIYPRAEIDCIKDAITAATDAESVNGVNALTGTLQGLTQECMLCDTVACPTSLLADELANLPMELADAIHECTGPLPPEPPETM